MPDKTYVLNMCKSPRAFQGCMQYIKVTLYFTSSYTIYCIINLRSYQQQYTICSRRNALRINDFSNSFHCLNRQLPMSVTVLQSHRHSSLKSVLFIQKIEACDFNLTSVVECPFTSDDQPISGLDIFKIQYISHDS